MNKTSRLYILVSGLIILVMLMLAACTDKETAEPEPAEPPKTNKTSPTKMVQATDVLPPTATFTSAPTDTPVPTDTPAPDLTATAVVESTAAAGELVAQIDAELQKYELSTSEGYLAWSQTEPLSVTTDLGNQTLFEPFAEGQSFSDFILRADITWESVGGLAGCGFIFRSQENLERGAQYRFYTIRLSGLPMWDIEMWKYGEWVNTLGGRSRTNSAIDQDNGATNSYLIHAKGELFTSYVNGERLGRLTSSTIPQGFFALFTFQESGKTTCTMSNAWIWALK